PQHFTVPSPLRMAQPWSLRAERVTTVAHVPPPQPISHVSFPHVPQLSASLDRSISQPSVTSPLQSPKPAAQAMVAQAPSSQVPEVVYGKSRQEFPQLPHRSEERRAGKA